MVKKKPRIVIVGAGMAGLTAAYRLHSSSGGLFDLCVVEAGDRIGGRILTSEFAGDRVEMGATWIHGIEGSPIYGIAREIHALDDSRPWERMDGFPEDHVTVAEGGIRVDPSIVDPISSLHRRLMDSARAGDAPVTKGLGVGSFLRSGLRNYRGSRDDCGWGGGGSRWTLEALEDAVFAVHENWERTCTSADELAELDLAAESEYRDFPGDQITIAKGYSRVIETLAAALPHGAIRLGRKVRRIEWCPDSGGPTALPSEGCPVRLHFDDRSVVGADHVIVTVSLGVLKAGLKKEGGLTSPLVFSPGLPSFKKEAIGRLGFGVVNKLFMETDDEVETGGGRFPNLQLAFDQDLESVRHVPKIPRWMRKTGFICPIYGGSRVLLAWLAGKEAMELETLDDEEIIRGINVTLDAFSSPCSAAETGYANLDQQSNGSAVGKKTKYGRIGRVKRSGWGTNPLFLGSYSYVSVGSSGEDLDLMAEPLPRGCRNGERDDCDGASPPPLQILFAGEATHRTHYSTTHGAYFSGVREANRLLQHYHV